MKVIQVNSQELMVQYYLVNIQITQEVDPELLFFGFHQILCVVQL